MNIHLFKRPKSMSNGKLVHYWTLKWYDNGGRRRYESIGRVGDMTRSDALSIQREKLVAMGSGKVSRDKPTKMTLGQFLEQDRDAIKSDVKQATIVTHNGVSSHAVAAIDDIELAKVDWTDVAKLKNWLGTEHVLNGRKLPPCSKATIRKTIVTLKAAFNRAIKRGLIHSIPFADERLAKIQPKQKRIYSHDEVAAMVAVASDIWWQTFIRLGFTSGLRVGEMLNLTWPDIDEPNGQVIVSAKRAGRFQVGDEDYPILPWSCKSHRERRVPLHPDAAALLAKLRMKAGASRYVFLSLQRLRRIESSTDVTREIPANGLVNNMLRTFKTIQGEARALPVGTMHDLRKSYGTHMSRRVTMPELRQLMGHASITTTADFYLDVSTDMSEKVRAVFASA